MRMRKALAAVLAAAAGCGSIPAYAADSKAPEPVLRAVCTEGYPGTDVTLTLECENNPGFQALGVTVQLPDVLAPDTADENAVTFTRGAALGSGDAYSFYQAESGKLSFVYAAAGDGTAEGEIAVFSLHVSEQAEQETAYPITVIPDMLTGKTGKEIAVKAENTAFTPLAWPEFTISETELTLKAGGAPYQLTVSPELPVGKIRWSSDNFDIAAVMPSGTVYGLQPGNAVITAKCGLQTLTCNVTVLDQLVLNITDYAAKIKGEQFQLKAADTDAALIFESSNPDIAAVSKDGTVRICAEGEADITVTAEGRSGVCHVTFLPYLRGDADLNGTITAIDAQTVLTEYLETEVMEQPSVLRAQQRLAADADLDGGITLRDAMLILQYYAELMNDEQPDWDALLAETGN